MLGFLKNSQVRLLFSASLFTGAFIWMAVTAYDVDKAEIQVFLIMSLIVLGVVIAAGCLFALVIFAFRKLRRSEGLLSDIATIEREAAQSQPEANAEPESSR